VTFLLLDNWLRHSAACIGTKILTKVISFIYQRKAEIIISVVSNKLLKIPGNPGIQDSCCTEQHRCT